MADPKLLCRLCMTSNFLSDLYAMDGDTSIDEKTRFCINLEIHPEDGLPTVICKKCKKRVKKFYYFKQKCLQVDFKLKTTMRLTISIDSDRKSADYNWKSEHNFLYSPEETKSDTDFDVKNQEHVKEGTENVSTKQTNAEDMMLSSVQCEFCGFIFQTKSELKKHLSSHGTSKLFQCDYCPKQFTRAENKINHTRSHLGVRPFICDICGSSSTRRQDLVRHMKIHSDEKKHACPNCGRLFKRSSDLCSHIRTHSGMRPYKCEFCEKDYTSHGGLRKHYNMHYKAINGLT